MNDKMLLTELKAIENKMDFIDGIRGDYWGKNQLCFWCGSIFYDGNIGVKHAEWCAKDNVRHLIKEMKIEKSDN